MGWSEVLAAERIRRVSVAGSRTPVSDAPHAPELGRAVSDAIVQAWGQPRRVPEAQYRPQLTIQTGHEQHAVLFCLPGAGDSVVAFTGLADALGDAWPVQGLQTRGLDGELVPHSTVEAAAAMHVRAIHDVQPRGAVHLLGHSFGGWLAFEVAHQLRNSGRSLASLTLIDSEPPGTDGVLGREYTGSEAMLELVAVLELAAGKSLGIDRASAEACAPPARLRLLHAACVRVGLMPRSSRPEALRGVLRAFSTALRTRYRPQLPYPDVVRLVLVSDPRCDERANRHQHQQTVEGWRRWAPLLAPCQAPGNHVAVLRPPHVRVLAEWLSGTSGKADGHVTRASRHAEA